MGITYGPPEADQLDRELAPIKNELLKRIENQPRKSRRWVFGAVSGVMLLGAGLSIAATQYFEPAEVSPSGFEVEFLPALEDCMDAAGWEAHRGKDDPSGEYSKADYYWWEFWGIDENIRWGDDWDICRTQVAEDNAGVDVMNE